MRWRSDDVTARHALVPLVYDELGRIAKHCLAGQRGSHTLQPTAFVHEAHMRLARRDSVDCQDYAHFFATAAQMMRHILVDHSGKKSAAKRGGSAVTLQVGEAVAISPAPMLDLRALDDAMQQLASLDPRQKLNCGASILWRALD